MAPKNRKNGNNYTKIWENARKYFTYESVKQFLIDPTYTGHVTSALFLIELFLNVAVIEKVKYTEIDWVAYMQECEGFLNGTLDYTKLRGDTGPLVYPAGFVYVYSFLYYVTSQGKNIRLAQYIFLAAYLSQLYLTFRIYKRTRKVPPLAIVLTILTSYRIHSIYVLRLFNDPIAVLFFYASLNLLLDSKLLFGSVLYSLAVSVKMNILLYAPCLLIFYLTNVGIGKTVYYIFVCGLVQLLLGAPFLYGNFIGYIAGSFNLGRVFEHKWTVNYRFLSVKLFENKYFHLSLLGLNVLLFLLFLPSINKYLSSYAKLKCLEDQVKPQLVKETKKNNKKKEGSYTVNFERVAQLLVLPFFVTNLIGVACARSLHYQFYSWYFHSLLYLAWSTGYSVSARLLLLAVVELCWNCYPSTYWSSALLHVCHVFLLVGVYRTMRSSTSKVKT